MWQFCLQFFLSFRENLVSLTHGKWKQKLTSLSRTLCDLRVELWRRKDKLGQKDLCFAVVSVTCSHFVLRLLRKPLFSAAIGWNLCRFVFVLLRTAWVLKSSKDLNLCFHAEAVTWWPGLNDRSVFRFCLNFVPLTTIKSVMFGENCVKSLRR